MESSGNDKFSGLDGVFYGAPLYKSKDVVAWQQQKKLIEAQGEMNLQLRRKAEVLHPQVQSGQMSNLQAQQAMACEVKWAVRGLAEAQHRVANGIVDVHDAVQHQTGEMVRGFGVLQQEQAHQTGEMVKELGVLQDGQQMIAGHLSHQTGETVKELGVLQDGQQMIAGAIHDSTQEQTRDINQSNRVLTGMTMGGGVDQILPVSQLTTKREQKVLMAMGFLESDLALTRVEWESYQNLSLPGAVQKGLISKQTLERLVENQFFSGAIASQLIESGLIKGSLGTTRRMNYEMERQTRVQQGQLALQDKQLEMSAQIFTQATQRNQLLNEIRGVLGITVEQSAAQTQLQMGIYGQSQHQTRIQEGLLHEEGEQTQLQRGMLGHSAVQTGLQAGMLGESRRQTDLQEGILNEAGEQTQLQRETLGYSAVQTGLQVGMLGESRRQTDLQEGILSEAGEQTHLQRGMLGESRRQTDLQEGLLSVSYETNYLLQGMSDSLCSRLDFSNHALASIHGQLDDVTHHLDIGFQNVVSQIGAVGEVVSHEMALTRFAVSVRLDEISARIFGGFTIIERQIAGTNARLDELISRMGKKNELAVLENAREAFEMMEEDDYQEAIEHLLEMKPHKHPYEFPQFLLGYCYMKVKDFVKATKYLGRAKKYSKKNPRVMEQATLLLSQIALKEGVDIHLSLAALKGIVEDNGLAPQLQFTHVQYASLLSILGNKAEAIGSTLEQLFVNPLLLKDLMDAEYLNDLKSDVEDQDKWRINLLEILESEVVFDQEDPHLAYFGLSLFAFSVLESSHLALSMLRRALDMWEDYQFPLSSQLFSEELDRFEIDLTEFQDQIIGELSEETHYNWITQ
jgi:tetratricopeptide (TPR) repeat protein